MALKLHIIIGSTRPGRIGPGIAQWFHGMAQQNGKFEATLVDLAEVNLPLFNESQHPRLRKYDHEHTKRWSALIDGADAFTFVTPEYNHMAPPSLINALDYLHHEWQYKPASFVSYGGPAGGARSVVTLKSTLVALKVMPMFESVMLPMVATQIKDGKFTANDGQVTAANVALDELYKWADALKVLRKK
ncbi:MAG TPA: NAD(P)H-dependent oxidoreductase [bacterium]